MDLFHLWVFIISVLKLDSAESNPIFGDCLCGQRDYFLQEAITGGKEANKNEFPWHALLYLYSTEGNTEARCGGSLINSKFVVTAAHCLQEEETSGAIKFLYDNIAIVLGEHDISQSRETTTFTTRAVDIRKHEGYFNIKSSGLLRYDVGLLELETEVDFSKYPHIRPICLPDPELDSDLSERTGVTVGWGATAVTYQATTCGFIRGVTDYSSVPNVLEKLEDIRFVSHEHCRETFHDLLDVGCPSVKIAQSVNLCATSISGDICHGDSGGGLVTTDHALRNNILVGITSFNLGCNASTISGEKLPSIFSDVRAVRDWITGKTRSGTFCRPRVKNEDTRGVVSSSSSSPSKEILPSFTVRRGSGWKTAENNISTLEQVRGSRVSDCERACISKSGCVGFTFVSSRGRCDLKRDDQAVFLEYGIGDSVISATLKLREGTGWHNRDNRVNSIKEISNIAGPEGCEVHCRQTRDCVGWTFVKVLNRCDLKAQEDAIFYDFSYDGVTSGLI